MLRVEGREFSVEGFVFEEEDRGFSVKCSVFRVEV